MSSKYVIGLDYGTDSVRAVVASASTGELLSSFVFDYPRWKKGLYCDAAASQFRQHPLDYLEGMEAAIKGALSLVSKEVVNGIVGLSIDTTGSTPVALDQNGTPLALLPEFAENPNAMFILWKDHTSIREAEEINALAHSWPTDFTKFSGGIYSSEWFWSKILRTLRVDSKVREKAYSWAEHSDWMPAVLTGNTDPLTMKRSRCSAGHKAMWHEEFGGLPSQEFLTQLDPLLTGIRERLYHDTHTADVSVGAMTDEWAERLGLPSGVQVGIGAIDAHIGAIGSAIKPYSFVRVMGTSTCDMLVAPKEEVGHLLVKGICGQVDGSILPGMLGFEAGQSAFGDVYAWFKKLILDPVFELISDEEIRQELSDRLLPLLSEKASALPLTESDPIALDWFNGRRTPDANYHVKGLISGLNLGTDAPRVFKALVEATAFGSKSIVDRFLEQGVPIKEVIAIGGVAKKSKLVMQTLANVLNMPIKVAASEQTCALGAAMCAAVVGGVYDTIGEAQDAMGSGFDAEYFPEPDKVVVYQQLYQKYLEMGDFIQKQVG
jgi:L-ribulokinase